ncbi:dienelactone hydrolase [Anaplasma marginale str. Dawn]|uniref:dihydroneopterin aldolase n=1 Tax=Anaplasma marginale TaxID=770 RepID=UPI0003C25C16|nr:dihydroneopterin aldolase [Anaplasma marginale]AGZ79655.1 dienelactone hydrolase [Anaplasma marginale str. Dawn]
MVVRLSIAGLLVYTQIGVYDWEKALKQKVLVNVRLSYPAKSNTICCSLLKKRVIAALEVHGRELLEDVAKDLIGCIVKEHPVVDECIVELSKPAASFMKDSRTSVAVIWRTGDPLGT